jgi:hypothetical protein
MQVCIGEGQVILNFHPSGYISIEGHWELLAADGQYLDSGQEHSTRDCYRIHAILGIPITSFRIDSPSSFTLLFQSGHSLTIYDSSSHYESCTVSLPNQPMIII